MSSPSEIDLEKASIAVPIRNVGTIRRPAWFENFDLEKVHHGKWKLVSGSAAFSGGIMTLYNAGEASEMRSDGAKFLYGALLIYAKLADANSIIGFDDGAGNHVRVTNDKFEVANAEAGTTDSVNVTIDETAYHSYLIVWHAWGCELWIDGVLSGTILSVMPHVELPVRLYAPSGGYCYVNSFQLWQDNPLVDPLGHQFWPKDINRLLPSVNPRGKVIFQDPMMNNVNMDILHWQTYFAGGAASQIANTTSQNEVFMGGKAIKMTPTTTDWIGICKTLGFLPSKRYGLECFIAIEGDTLRGASSTPHDLIDYVRIFIDWYEAGFFFAGAIQWVPTSLYLGKWQYAYGESGGYQFKDWEGFTQKLMLTCLRDYSGWGADFWYWLYFRMVVDFDARKYVEFQANDQRMGIEQSLITDQVQKYTQAIEDHTLDFGVEYKLKATTRTPSIIVGMAIFTDEEIG